MPTLDIVQGVSYPFPPPNQFEGGFRAWQQKYLPWTTGDANLFRRIGSSKLWDPDASKDLWMKWWKLGILMSDPSINEIQVQPTTSDPTRCSVISKGPRGMLVHPDLEMSSLEVLDGLNQITVTGLKRPGIRGYTDTEESSDTEVAITTELDDGPRVSRLTAVVSPASVAPVMAIRRFPMGGIPLRVITGQEPFERLVHPYAWPGQPIPTMGDPLADILLEAAHEKTLVPWASAPNKALAYILQSFAHKKNLLVYGETGSGKTTMLQTLLRNTNHNLRVGVIEIDANELTDLPHYNQFRLNATTPDKDPKRTTSVLTSTTLRLTPTIASVAEVRAGEAYDLCQLALSGHTTAATLHAGTQWKAVRRMCSMTATGAPQGTDAAAVRSFVYDSTNMLVHVEQQVHLGPDGSPRTVQRVNAIHELIVQEDETARIDEIFHTELDDKGAPCLVWSGSLGTLDTELKSRHAPLPEWSLTSDRRKSGGRP